MNGLLMIFGFAIVILLMFILLVLVDIRTAVKINNVWAEHNAKKK